MTVEALIGFCDKVIKRRKRNLMKKKPTKKETICRAQHRLALASLQKSSWQLEFKNPNWIVTDHKKKSFVVSVTPVLCTCPDRCNECNTCRLHSITCTCHTFVLFNNNCVHAHFAVLKNRERVQNIEEVEQSQIETYQENGQENIQLCETERNLATGSKGNNSQVVIHNQSQQHELQMLSQNSSNEIPLHIKLANFRAKMERHLELVGGFDPYLDAYFDQEYSKHIYEGHDENTDLEKRNTRPQPRSLFSRKKKGILKPSNN